jgi:tyrosine-specific transport protein
VPYETICISHEKGEEATLALCSILGSSWISRFAQGFAFFSIVTSFLAQGLTLTHFLADGLKKAPTKKNLKWICVLSLAPPLFFALLNPQIFFKALSLAGGIFAMILFGLLPVCMAWIGRYVHRHSTQYRVVGGKCSLLVALGFSVLVIGCEIARLFL